MSDSVFFNLASGYEEVTVDDFAYRTREAVEARQKTLRSLDRKAKIRRKWQVIELPVALSADGRIEEAHP
jgi:hypothetical protein